MSTRPEGMSEEQFQEALDVFEQAFFKTFNFGWDLGEIGAFTEGVDAHFEAIMQTFAQTLSYHDPARWERIEAKAYELESERRDKIADAEIDDSISNLDAIIEQWAKEVDKP